MILDRFMQFGREVFIRHVSAPARDPESRRSVIAGPIPNKFRCKHARFVIGEGRLE